MFEPFDGEGPKAMIINAFSGSGGDWMPYHFRQRGLGKLIGKRTWGGLVGTLNSHQESATTFHLHILRSPAQQTIIHIFALQ